MRLDLNPLLFYTSEFRYVEWNFNNLLGIMYWCHLKCLLEIFGFIPNYFVSSSIFNEVYINWIWVFVLLEICKWIDSNLNSFNCSKNFTNAKHLRCRFHHVHLTKQESNYNGYSPKCYEKILVLQEKFYKLFWKSP